MVNAEDTGRIHALLTSRAEQGADAASIAGSVLDTWHAISAALTPVLGQRGVTALFWRCLHLTGMRYGWLKAPHGGGDVQPDLAALTAALRDRAPLEAAEGGAALLTTLHDLLASLIGPALTDELLRSAWTHLSGGPTAQDTLS